MNKSQEKGWNSSSKDLICPSVELQPFIQKGVSYSYRNALKKGVQFLCRHQWHALSSILGTLLAEPWQAIKSGVTYIYGWKKHFNFYDLNPIAITESQANLAPILFIHGNFHNQSAVLPFVKKLNKKYEGPIYTVNLPNETVTYRDYKIVEEKIIEIIAQYQKHNSDDVKIHLVNHSRGATVAMGMAWPILRQDEEKPLDRFSEKIGKLINLGSVLSDVDRQILEKNNCDFQDRIYEITGLYDILETQDSKNPSTHKAIIQAGHLGLLHSHEAHCQIIHWLNL